MLVHANELDISKIADSGQCFRMVENGDGSYGVIHQGRYLEITPVSSDSDSAGFFYEFSCDEEEYEMVWKHYFDMSYEYENISGEVDESDEFLNNAIRYGSGIRILNQDPWEMLISFIISQRKSIPAIRTSIEKLCTLCGKPIETKRGIRYSFPDAEAIAALSDEELMSCSLGYRSKYIAEAARQVVTGELDVYALTKCNDEELKNNLLNIYGVGVKVANCVMLFGYHRLDSFPEDVWIKRALEQYYPEGFPYGRYEGYGGIMQQYIFFYMRNSLKK